MSSTFRILDGAALAVVLFLLSRFAQSRRRLPLPPGPLRLPLVGNAFILPIKEAWKTYSKWGQIYGPLTFAKLINRPIVIINSAEAAFDLLERRGQIYSDRPVRPLLKWTGSARGLVSQSHGPRMQQMRRLAKEVGGKAAALEHEATVVAEVHRFLRRTLEGSSPMVENIQLASGSAILDINYGYDTPNYQDQMLRLLMNGIRTTLQLLVEKPILPEFFPWLGDLASFIPGNHFYKIAARVRQILIEVDAKPYAYTKSQLAAGAVRSSFVAKQLDDPNLTPEKELIIRAISSNVFFAGYETTANGIYSMVLAMMLYPEVQTRAQAEIDSVIGADRLPTLQDRSELPYIGAIVKEALRWMPPTPEGVPHRVCQDDEYMGYHIPKNSTIIVNIKGICYDPVEYPNPHIFDPTRFLGDKQQRDPSDLVFGFGRRICPGQPFAEAAIFLYTTALLSMFNISQDKAFTPIDREDSSKIPVYPTPLMSCRAVLRSESSRPFINSAVFRDEN